MNEVRYPDPESKRIIVQATMRLKLSACKLLKELQQAIIKKMQLLSSGFLSATDFENFLDEALKNLQQEKQKSIFAFEIETQALQGFLNTNSYEAKRMNAALAAYCVYFDNDLIGEATYASKQWWMYMQGEFRFPELYVYLEEAFLPIHKRCNDWVFTLV